MNEKQAREILSQDQVCELPLPLMRAGAMGYLEAIEKAKILEKVIRKVGPKYSDGCGCCMDGTFDQDEEVKLALAECKKEI